MVRSPADVVTLRRIGLLAGLMLALATSMAAFADVVPVVSAKSSVEHLSRKDLADIFLGRLSRLPDGAQVVPIDQEEGSSARDEFYATYVGKTPAQLRALWSKIIFTGRGKPPLVVPRGGEVRKLLAGNPYAITYLDRGQLDSTVKAVRVE